MKSFQNLLLLLTAGIAPIALAVPFEDDRQDFYVEGQVVNDAMEEVNFLLCIANAMRPDALVNQGAYLATLYDEDCKKKADDAAGKSAATPTSASSSTTASSTSGTKAKAKVSTSAVLKVERSDENSPSIVKAWIPLAADPTDQEQHLAETVYMAITQTGGVTEASPNGDFVMNFSANIPETNELNIFGAYAEASGATVKYRDWAGEASIVKQAMPNGDSQGVFGLRSVYEPGENVGNDQPGGELITSYQFYVSIEDKAYCQRLSSATTEAWNDEGVLVEREITDRLFEFQGFGLSIDEQCYSTDVSKAQRNVYRYGVYINGGANDGNRLSAGQSGFPLYADITNNEGEVQRIHAYADYWGVWVDPEGRALIDSNTAFRRETFDDVDAIDVVYNLTSTDVRIEKRETFYIPLNDLDGLSVTLHVNDDWWSSEYTALFGEVPAFEEYEGKFVKDGAVDGSGQFVFSTGVSFSSGYETTVLSTPIRFSLAQWQTHMAKEYGQVTDDWYFKEVKGMGVWSNDTRQWYEISSEAMSSPTSATSGAGVRTEIESIILPSDITETLYCIRDCLDSGLTLATFTAAANASSDTDTVVASPYAAVSPLLENDVQVTRVHNEFGSASEISQDFWLADNSIESVGFKLGMQGAVVTDFVNGDANLKAFLPIEFDGLTGEDSSGSTVYTAAYYMQGGFSLNNLNKLISADASDPGVVPEFNLDIRSIPAAGTSGSMSVNVSVGQDGGTSRLTAEVALDYASDGSQFSLTVPNGAVVSLTYVTENGVSISSNYVTNRSATFAYYGGPQSFGSVASQTGLSWDIFQLFSGSAGLGAFNSAGIADFFTANDYYQALVTISDTDLEMEGPGPDGDVSFQKMEFNFAVRDDSSLSYTETYESGQNFQDVLATDAYKYTAESGQILDINGVPLTKGSVASAVFNQLDDPNRLLERVSFVGAEGYQQFLSWGVRTGQLVAESELPKLECRKIGLDRQYEWHPVYGTDTDALRYCEYQMYEGGISTTYNISLEATPGYAIKVASTGAPVVIAQPKTLYYAVPETLDAEGEPEFGEDAGKRLRLEFAGHGELHGIPGFVFDTATGNDLGEFVTDWLDSYRYLSRFVIPDGGLLIDGLDDTVTYKVKALDGEEWLVDADGSVAGVDDVRGRYTDLYSLSNDDLLTDYIGSVRVGDPGDIDNYIGEKPTVLINDGKASVVHGDVVFTPAPSAVINDGEPSVVYGDVVFPPAPSAVINDGEASVVFGDVLFPPAPSAVLNDGEASVVYEDVVFTSAP